MSDPKPDTSAGPARLPTHVQVPLQLWQELAAYIQSVPTGPHPLQAGAQLLSAMQNGVENVTIEPKE